MEKKCWTTPRVDFVQFAANEYVATCSKMLSLVCNAFGVIFHDYNGNKQADRLNDPNGKGAFYYTFGIENSWTYPKDLNYFDGSKSGESFYDAYENSSVANVAKDYDQDMGVLLPEHCDNQKMTVSMDSIHFGFAQYSTSSPADYVFIWHNSDGTNIHASKFDQDAWDAANHS